MMKIYLIGQLNIDIGEPPFHSQVKTTYQSLHFNTKTVKGFFLGGDMVKIQAFNIVSLLYFSA